MRRDGISCTGVAVMTSTENSPSRISSGTATYSVTAATRGVAKRKPMAPPPLAIASCELAKVGTPA